MGRQNVITTLEDVAVAALDGDSLRTRSLMQDWLAGHPDIGTLPPPFVEDPTVRSLVASLVELMAQRLGQTPPAWAADIGPAPRPTHLLQSAARMSRLRAECERSSPLPLRRRHFYAPENYLDAR
jgi:hypothetical protein